MKYNESNGVRKNGGSPERIIEIIGESARRVSTDYQKTHPEIHWHKIIGQRNILAHEYEQINHELLYKTATDDLPKSITIIITPL